MDTNVYVYYFISDKKSEPIGRVKATSLHDALKQIAVIKHLDINDVAELFRIQQIM